MNKYASIYLKSASIPSAIAAAPLGFATGVGNALTHPGLMVLSGGVGALGGGLLQALLSKGDEEKRKDEIRKGILYGAAAGTAALPIGAGLSMGGGLALRELGIPMNFV